MFELPQTRKHKMNVFTTISHLEEEQHYKILGILQYLEATKVIVAYEETQTAKGLNRHYHTYSEHPIQDWPKLQKKIRYQFHKLNISKCKIEVPRDADKSQIYCLKDGNYITKGYEEGEIGKYKAQTYVKPIPFKQQLLQLEQNYISKKCSAYQATMQYSRIHRLCNINYTENKMKGWMTRIKCSRDPQFEEKLCQRVAASFESPEKKYFDIYKTPAQCRTKEEFLDTNLAALDILKRDTTEKDGITLT
jgi:hypothetical protein